MTEFELMYLTNETISTIAVVFAAYFSTLSAFLIAGYLAAHKLTRTMLVLVVGLFSLWSALAIFTLYRTVWNLFGLQGQIRDFARAGKGLAWHGAVGNPQWFVHSGPMISLGLYVAMAIAALYLFFHCRIHNRQSAA
ncbi:MAG: hypothetical protein ACREQB_04880 [Candidatus Binataceae bacterium]